MLKPAHAIFEDLVHWRRDFHMHPELGFHETRTSEIVAQELEKLGYRVRRGVGRTGVLADFGDGNGRTIAIRADMDALPILEARDREYASRNPGVMHACGHDSHTSMALGAAALLARETFPGRVRFLFQPSEETEDEEGVSGAPRMVQDGALEGVDLVIAQHVDPHTPVGQVGINAGVAGGGVTTWYATILGVGGHGAHPNETVDPFFLLSQVIVGLNGIVSRRLHPFEAAVVSIGQIHGGFTENVIPEKVDLSGTLRFASEAARQKIESEMRRAFEVARALGGDYELRFVFGCPPLVNHPLAAELIQAAAADLLGAENVQPIPPTLGAEDFGSFIETVPGAMYTLGTLIEGDERALHHPRFDIDERALPIGAALLAETTLRFLREKV
ncbi:MAG: M20 metallopeptidase family protein [Chloroflexota bacterium]